MFSIILLLIVFIAIAVRKIGRWRLPIWLIMLVSASLVLLSGHISVGQAYQSIHFDVLFYLFGVFVIGQALQHSHYLQKISFGLFGRATTLNILLLFMVFIFGALSVFLMNDTVAIIGVPIILLLSRQHSFSAVFVNIVVA